MAKMSGSSRWEVRLVTTIPFESSPGRLTRFTVEALQGLADAINGGLYVPMHVEHLSYLPPMGKMVGARIEERQDGEYELVVEAEEVEPLLLPEAQAEIAAIPHELDQSPADLASEIEMRVEPRLFSDSDLADLQRAAPIPLREHQMFAFLPPLEIVIGIPVAVGISAFVKNFMGELGTAAAKGIVEWLRSARKRAKNKDLHWMLTLQFSFPDGTMISGYMPFSPAEDPTPEALAEAHTELARVVESHLTNAVLGDIARAAFLYMDSEWKLAWLSRKDGSVHVTPWYATSAPNPELFLGHKPLKPPDAESSGPGDGEE